MCFSSKSISDTELCNTKSGFKEDKHTIIVSFVMLIILNEFQELSLLFSGYGFSCYTIVYNYCT